MARWKVLYQKAMLQMQGLINEYNMWSSPTNPEDGPSPHAQAYTAMLTTKDLILCANRYVHKNLPTFLTSQQYESLFYRFGALCHFYDDEGKFTVSTFATVGPLDKYGRLSKIQPIQFDGKTPIGAALSVAYEDTARITSEKYAVIINDYTADYMNVTPRPRAEINATTTISDQVLVYSQLKNNIFLSAKKALALCANDEQRKVLKAQIKELFNPAEPIGAIVASGGKMAELAEMFNFDNNFDTQNYCQQIDYYDKVRRSFNGIPAPDTFEKKERKVTGETEDTTTHTDLVLLDGYLSRFAGIELLKKVYPGREDLEKWEVEIQPFLSEKEKTEAAPLNTEEDDEDYE